ncbi:MAG: tetratricopeptide repeat protein [Anaerolineaceae bacterium]
MPQYEYKVIKVPIIQQTYYCSFMACFGWQVQNMQESVDRVVNRSMGFSNTTNSGHFNATTYFPSHTNHANTYGYSHNYGWGSQMNMEVSDVQSSLTITFFRDTAIPYHGELVDIEKRFFAATPAYLQRCAKDKSKDHDQWPERKAVNACADAGRAILARRQQQAQKQVTAQQSAQTSTTTTTQPQTPVQIPSEPASAAIREMEVTHNVFQSNQAGMQIRLNFSIKNRKDIQCRAVAYFFDKQHHALQDVNQRFKTADGKVSVGSTFKPGFDETFYNNYILFMPYSELDQKDGDYQFGFNVQIYDEVTKSFLSSSADTFFHYSQKGQSMRGENSSSAVPSTTITDKPKTSTKPEHKITPPPQSKPAAVPQRPSFKEYSASFCQKNGWDVLNEDRKVFLEGLSYWYKDYQSKEAQTSFKKALAMNPKEPIYWSWVCMPYFNALQFDEAVTFLKKGLKELPQHPILLSTLGNAHIRKMDLEEAQKVADELAVSGDKLAKIGYHDLMGQIAEARQDYKTAIQCYDRANALRDPEAQKIMTFNQDRCRNLMKHGK